MSRSDQCLRPEDRLRDRRQFSRCYRTGKRRHGRWSILYVHRNEHGEARLGITASRKTGKAVRRHRLKRWIRETFRRWPHRDSLPALDIVVHLKPNASQVEFPALRQELDRLLTSLISSPRP